MSALFADDVDAQGVPDLIFADDDALAGAGPASQGEVLPSQSVSSYCTWSGSSASATQRPLSSGSYCGLPRMVFSPKVEPNGLKGSNIQVVGPG